MQNTLINITLAFIEGLGLIASPCILPILPIVLSGSLTGSKKRPYGIIVGFVITFALFTFFSKTVIELSGINANLIRNISFGLLLAMGLIMLSTTLTEKFGLLTQRFATVGIHSKNINNTEGSFFSGILFGALIALIWTPCAGPILAAVIVQTVLQKTTFNSFLILLFFAFGAGVPMLLISIFGRTLLSHVSFLKNNTQVFRKLLGLIIIASVGLLIYQNSFSASTFTTTKNGEETAQTALINGITPYTAPAITGITEWINTAPLDLNTLKGKVVLIDFWTYSCINCARTLPYIKDWYTKYHNKGLVIIGVHTPEFAFEKDVNNVKNAVIKDGINYPVALDSNFSTWQNYNNSYWPAHYLIDKNGNVVYTHFGEGDYDVTENNIRFLLGLNKITNDTSDASDNTNTFADLTPETYLGFARADRYSSPETLVKNAEGNYTFPPVLADNDWALTGKWIVSGEHIVSAGNNAGVKIRFHAKKLYIVMGNASKNPITVKLLLNGEAVIAEKGKDVTASSIRVNSHGLFEAIIQQQVQPGVLELTADNPGLEIYTFTFGS